MDLRECLLTRRSVRKYKSDPLSDELLMKILEPALAAPSGANRQHWHFVVIRSPESMKRLREYMLQAVELTSQEMKERFAKNPEVVEQTRNFFVTLGGAPVCILAFQMEKAYSNPSSATQSVAAAIENLLLSAWAEGVGTCWISPPMTEEFKEEVRRAFAPEKGPFVAAVTMGYPDQTPEMPRRRDGRYVFI